MRLISDVNCMVDEIGPVRLKGRGITVYRLKRVPSQFFYEVQPGLWVGHPVLIRALQEQVDREMREYPFLADLYQPAELPKLIDDPILNYLKEHLR